ncbi:MAG: 1-phosphofructokinase family hexose kinase [Anaerolineae bacterium]
MIVTLTPNTTIDHTVFIPAYQPGKTIRATHSLFSTGGKPTDASYILGALGIPSLALGFAAGNTGKQVEALLRGRGVTVDYIQVEGESRLNTVIVTSDGHPQTTITTATMQVLPEHIEALWPQYKRALDQASVVVTGGTLPKGVQPAFYDRAISMARERGIPVIFDAAQPNLSAGLHAKPTFIKPNADELTELVGESITSLEAAFGVGQSILDQYGTASVMTFGGEGALAVLPDKAYRIPPLKITVSSAAGAGDAVLAGLAASIERGQPVEEGLRLGIAAAAAVCMLPGTADCRREDVERLLPQVELIPFGL